MSTISAGTTLTTALVQTGDTTGSLTIKTNNGSTTAATFDTSGNLGLGVTPSGYYQLQTQTNYQSGSKGFNLSSFSGGTSGNGVPYVGYNIRPTSTAGTYNYNQTDYASAISFYDGIKFYTAPSGTAGTAISFTQAMTLDASGNLGIGTASPVVDGNGATYLTVNSSSGGMVNPSGSQSGTSNLVGGLQFSNTVLGVTDKRISAIYGYTDGATNSGSMRFFTWNGGTAAESMRINSSGTLLVGTTTGHGIFTVAQNNTKMWVDCQPSYIEQSMTDSSASNIDWYLSTKGTGAFIWRQGGTSEVMRIDPQGYLQAHAGTGSLTNPNYHSFRTATSSTTWVMYQRHETSTAGNAYGTKIEYRNVAPNGTGNEFLFCSDQSSTRATIRSNGGLANYQANNANLSDIRTKKDIELAGSYLNKICAIPVKTFLYKDQTDSELNLGVIAQDVEAVAPELIDNTGFGETPEDGVPLKAIYQTDLQYALMKCIQEQQAIISDLKARIETLENK